MGNCNTVNLEVSTYAHDTSHHECVVCIAMALNDVMAAVAG